MRTFTGLLALVATLLSLSACTKFVAGKHDDAELKNHAANWGVPKMRPVVWGFTGIERNCSEADCPQTRK